jgi:integrase
MGKVDAPYLVTHKNSDGTGRYYFAPKQVDRKHGWATVRLHDTKGRPIRDPLSAAEACRRIAVIYAAWRAGEPGKGPWCIDKIGRVVEEPRNKPSNKEPTAIQRQRFQAGQVGAMVADYMDHDVFTSNSKKTQKEYAIYLNLFVEEFGSTPWRKLAPGVVRNWLIKRAEQFGGAGAHALYRTTRAFFGKVRLCYDSVDHPGFVPESQNPLASLDLSLPKSTILPWPREAISAFVALADELDQPSMGDAIATMSWLGVRRQDWLTWPADFFDRDLIAFRQAKTHLPNVLPWSTVPELVQRVAAAKARRAADAVTSSTFFHDKNGKPWGKPGRFRRAFNELRDELSKKYPTFPARYYVGLIEGEPLALPTSALTMRTMRHTCVTLNFDAGVPPNLIRGITGHTDNEINDILKHYRARTADQAEAALKLRVAHEAKGATS